MRWTKPIFCLWTLPNTLLGIWPVLVMIFQPSARIHLYDGVIELSGGLVKRMLGHNLFGVTPVAITFGHVVWAIDDFHMQRTRTHERVHVRQYEYFGPFFLPAYLLCSIIQKLRGLDAYHDNPFERQAYNVSD